MTYRALPAAALVLALAPAAGAQEPTPTETGLVVPMEGHYEGDEFIPETRDTAPNTDACPQATQPPAAVSTSEAAAPPDPLPVLYDGPCGTIAPAGFNVAPEVVASAWLVADLDSGEIVAMKDPHGRYRPASVIKVLLAMVAIRELPPEKVVTVSQASADQEGSAVGLVDGGRYTVNDLLHGLLLASGNDAAHALAQELGGDAINLQKVNALAKELGMEDTRVVTYSGLDAPGMSSSVHDLGRAYRAAFADPTFARIVGTEFYDFPGQHGEPGFQVWNDNQLFMMDPDGIGGKTGYTDDANHTFVGAVDHEGRRLVAVILDTTANTARPWEQAQKLLHESYRFRDSVGTLEAAPEPEPAPETTQAAPVEAAGGPVEWRSIAIVGGVLLTALVALVVSLSTAAKRRRGR